jgi:hypothetical protein
MLNSKNKKIYNKYKGDESNCQKEFEELDEKGIKPFLNKVSANEGDLANEQFFKVGDFSYIYDIVYTLCGKAIALQEKLFKKYTRTLANYLANIVKSALEKSLSQHNYAFLRCWIAEWNKYSIIVKGLSYLFMYLNNHYVVNRRCKTLLRHGFILYRESIYDSFYHTVSRCVMILLQNERDGKAQDRDLIKKSLSIFVELNARIDEENFLSLYENDFQKELLIETDRYYKVMAREWIAKDTFSDYLKRVESILKWEKTLSDAVFDSVSKSPLIECIQQELICNLLETLFNKSRGMKYILDNVVVGDLDRVYRIFSKIREEMLPVSKFLENYITELGNKIVVEARRKEYAEGSFITDIILLNSKYSDITEKYFSNSAICRRAIREAFTNFINAGDGTSKLLAEFTNSVLSSKYSAANITDSMLDGIVRIYGYLRDKDIFENSYTVYLSHRLLNNYSNSEQSERNMIAKLRIEGGYHWTTNLEKMLKDMQLSMEFQGEFSSMLNRRKEMHEEDIDLHVKICTIGCWPITDSNRCHVPPGLKKICNKFREFYKHSYSGRQLRWNWKHGESEVLVHFNEKVSKILITTSYQMLILLMFNSKDVYTFSEISETTNIPETDLQINLLSLCHPQVKVLLKKPNIKKITPDDRFRINDDYSSKLYRTKIPQMKSSSLQKKESEREMERVEKQRSHQVDACIVRIMKGRLEIKHQLLIADVVRQLTPRFIPTIPLIKARIASLIEQEYITRNLDKRNIYNYVA